MLARTSRDGMNIRFCYRTRPRSARHRAHQQPVSGERPLSGTFGKAPLALALALHALGTKAAKHGGLSVLTRSLDRHWSADQRALLVVE
jgi:hypothetical protein